MDLNGSWSSSLTFGQAVLPANTFTLRLSANPWEIQGVWSFQGLALIGQSFTFHSELGPLRLGVGANFKPAVGMNFGQVLSQNMSWSGGFASFELRLGNLILSLTLAFGPAER